MKRRDVYSYLALVLAVIVFFFEILTRKYFLWEDFLEFFYPLRNFLAVSLKNHRIPYWCPYIFSGMPFLSEPQTAVFYPFNLINVLFVKNGVLSYYALEIELILHFLMASLFMYLLLRRWKFNPLPSIAGSIVYTFSGFMVLHSIHGNLIHTAAYYPLLLYLLDRFMKEPNLLWGLIYLVFLYLATLAGYPQLITYWFLFSGVYLLFLVWIDRRFIARRIIYFGIIFLVFVLLWMWQLSSTTFMTHFTERKVLAFAASSENSVPLIQLLQRLFLPTFFGKVNGLLSKKNYYFGGPTWNFWESGIYVGVVSIILSLFAFYRRRDKKVWFFFFISLASLLLVAGKYGLLYKILYYLLPPIRRFRNPPRFSIFLSLSVGILTAYGLTYLEALTKERKESKPQILKYLWGFSAVSLLFLFAVILMVPGDSIAAALKKSYMIKSTLSLFIFATITIGILELFIRKKKKELLYILPVLIFFDLYLFGHDFPLGEIKPELYYSRNRLPSMIFEDRGVFRVNIRRGSKLVAPRNCGAIMGLEVIDGYEVLRFKRYLDFYDNVPFESKIDLLNVKYYLETDIEGKSFININGDYLPRAFFVSDYRVLSRDTILAILGSGWEGYRDTVLLEEKPPVERGELQRGEIGPIVRTGDGIKFKVRTEGKGIIVISEVFYPERDILVDGKPVKKFIAYNTLMAFVIEPGEHTVELVYNPRSFKRGLKFTLIGAILALVLIPLGVIERRRKNK